MAYRVLGERRSDVASRRPNKVGTVGIRDKAHSNPQGATRADDPSGATATGATGAAGLSTRKKAGLGCLSTLVALGLFGSCLGAAGAGNDTSKPAPTVTVTSTITATPTAAPTVTATVTTTATVTATITAAPSEVTQDSAATSEPTQDPVPASDPTSAQPRPLVQQPTEEAPAPDTVQSFASCAEARAAGAAPVHSGDPGYSRRIDRDGDGVACE